MKKLWAVLLFLIAGYKNVSAYPQVWTRLSDKEIISDGKRVLFPAHYQVYKIDMAYVRSLLTGQASQQAPVKIDLPISDGSMQTFALWYTPVMAKELSAKYPEIKTFTGVAVGNKKLSIKVDITYKGFHAMMTDGVNTSFIDPYTDVNDGNYICYNKQDYSLTEQQRMSCAVHEPFDNDLKDQKLSLTPSGLPDVNLQVNGMLRRTYRLALAATIEYSAAVGGSTPTKASVLSAMVTTINRVNSVYERELSVTMQLIGNTDNLIYLSGTDPYSNGSGPAMLSENQSNIDNIIGTANYDIGHVFSTGGGGIADVGVVCDDQYKARGVTGRNNPVGDPFDIDYVAHEMGHQFGGNHTFNANTGSCSGNIYQLSAYEPGSGSTIMAYAGICTGNNIQSNSSAYFHAKSLVDISNYINSPFGGAACGTAVPSGNTPVSVPSFAATYYIPFKTPFEITAPEASDVDHDILTYCWEEYDLGDFGSNFSTTQKFGPIFRSFEPDTSRTRIFPTLEKLLKNETSYLGEKLPEVDRTLRFRLTVRDILNGFGVFNFPDDTVLLNVVNTGFPFAVQSPNTKSDYWQIGSSVSINWDVASTTGAPINCSNVDILLSLDNGHTYPYVLAANTSNDGSETITVPNAPTASARVKVKAVGNVFFDISNEPFIINNWPTSVHNVSGVDGIKIYPIPAQDILHIELSSGQVCTAIIINALGQQLYTDIVSGKQSINISGWSSGVYNLQLVSQDKGTSLTRRFVVK